MNEEEWLACAEQHRMLPFLRLRGVLTERKRRLFTVACCRRIDHLLTAGAREAVRVVEQFADGHVGADAVGQAREAIGHPRTEPRGIAASAARAASLLPETDFDDSAGVAGSAAQAAATEQADVFVANVAEETMQVHLAARAAEEAAQADLLRDIFGNPFCPIAIDPAWRTSTVVALAKGIYDERAFDRMPILADALQEAGCENEEVLNHCRDPHQVHVRGCWVVDLVLGKS